LLTVGLNTFEKLFSPISSFPDSLEATLGYFLSLIYAGGLTIGIIGTIVFLTFGMIGVKEKGAF
jgi:hypothetical protein